MSNLIGTWLMGHTKWGKAHGTGGDLISWAWWKWSVPRLIRDRTMRDWKIASASNSSLQFLLKFNTSQQMSPASLPLFVFTVDTQLHTHMLSSCNAQICRKHAHPHKFKHTHTHTEGLVFFLRVEYVFGSIISLWYWAILHMLKGMCWRCGEKVGRNTHTHTQQTHPHTQVLIQPLIVIRLDGLGVKAVVQ